MRITAPRRWRRWSMRWSRATTRSLRRRRSARMASSLPGSGNGSAGRGSIGSAQGAGRWPRSMRRAAGTRSGGSSVPSPSCLRSNEDRLPQPRRAAGGGRRRARAGPRLQRRAAARRLRARPFDPAIDPRTRPRGHHVAPEERSTGSASPPSTKGASRATSEDTTDQTRRPCRGAGAILNRRQSPMR